MQRGRLMDLKTMEDFSVFRASACIERTIKTQLALVVLLALSFNVQQSKASHNNIEIDPEESNQVQQGGWSHWWSYDGISGPDYWNINKHWRLCALGRKQSPVNVRTDRLLYDHLLGPLKLRWHARAKQLGDSGGGDAIDQGANSPAGKNKSIATAAAAAATATDKQTVQLRLINSGRGIEAWLLEGTAGGGATDDDDGLPPERDRAHKPSQRGEQLHLSRGPLSYEYALFKMELHAASATSGSFLAAAAAIPPDSLAAGGRPQFKAAPNANEIERDRHQNDAEKTGRPPNGHKPDNFKAAAHAVAEEAENETKEADETTQEEEEEELVPEALRATRTSEHLIDGRPFEGELQLHFYNGQLASSALEAQRLANEQPLAGLFAVISVFISLVGQPATGARGAAAAAAAAETPLDFILDHLGSVQNQGDSIGLRVEPRKIEALVTDRRQYVTYQGSMNRPPCAENVDWILLNRALRVDAAKFALLFERPNTNQENVRPIKQLNGRLLRTSIGFGARAPLPHGLHQTSEGPAAACAASSPAAKANCTTGQQQRQQLCNMKPNYAYHPTFADKPQVQV